MGAVGLFSHLLADAFVFAGGVSSWGHGPVFIVSFHCFAIVIAFFLWFF